MQSSLVEEYVAPTGYTVKNTFLEPCVAAKSGHLRRSKTHGDVPSHHDIQDVTIDVAEMSRWADSSSYVLSDFSTVANVPPRTEFGRTVTFDGFNDHGCDDQISGAILASWSYEDKDSFEVPKVSDLCRVVTFDCFEHLCDQIRWDDADFTSALPDLALSGEVPRGSGAPAHPSRPAQMDLGSAAEECVERPRGSVRSSADSEPDVRDESAQMRPVKTLGDVPSYLSPPAKFSASFPHDQTSSTDTKVFEEAASCVSLRVDSRARSQDDARSSRDSSSCVHSDVTLLADEQWAAVALCHDLAAVAPRNELCRAVTMDGFDDHGLDDVISAAQQTLCSSDEGNLFAPLADEHHTGGASCDELAAKRLPRTGHSRVVTMDGFDDHGFDDVVSASQRASWSSSEKDVHDAPTVSGMCRVVTFDDFEHFIEHLDWDDADPRHTDVHAEGAHRTVDVVPVALPDQRARTNTVHHADGVSSAPPVIRGALDLASALVGCGESARCSVDSSAERNPVADPAPSAGGGVSSPLSCNIRLSLVSWEIRDAPGLFASNTRKVVSPWLDALPGIQVKATVVSSSVSGKQGSRSFRDAKGRGALELKCEAASAPLTFRVWVGSAARRDGVAHTSSRGPFTHDFAVNSTFRLPGHDAEWDFAPLAQHPPVRVCLEFQS
mmetsp:Transcript_37931/g.101072  ORF Transcript_37931/g.101072 Transcript_37931/m.101072 type:complete len:665 (-) Transcript_37931:457-2451(-)